MKRREVIAALALAGIFVALYLTLYKMGAIGELSCRVGSCETVNSSRWAIFLGAPVAAWGVAYYIVVFAVALAGLSGRFADSRQLSLALLLLTGWGVLFSSWLTYLELFVIRAICQWCVVSALIVVAIFLVSLWDYLDRRSPEDVAGGSKM